MLDFISKEVINKGWSADRKFCVTARDNTKYLLRITPFEKSANRREMFEMQQRVARLGVPMCEAVEIGECGEGVYTLQTWIDGDDAGDMIPCILGRS